MGICQCTQCAETSVTQEPELSLQSAFASGGVWSGGHVELMGEQTQAATLGQVLGTQTAASVGVAGNAEEQDMQWEEVSIVSSHGRPPL